MNRSEHMTAHPYYLYGIEDEREHIIRTLLKRKVIRRDSLGYLVFANCDTLNIEYLPELERKGETK